MLQDIGEHFFLNAFQPRPPEPADIALHYRDGEALIFELPGGEPQLPRFELLLTSHPGIMEGARYLFSIDGQGFFLADGLDPERVDGASMRPTEVFRAFAPDHMGFAGAVGCQLFRFYRDNRYCGRCASPMEPSAVERAQVCAACGGIVYPKISPAVIVGVTDGDRLLMTRYAGRPYNRYALVAGFTEFGEAVERTVEREVMEEVGLRVRNIRYFASQPWPFSDSLLLGFFCDLDGDDRIRLDEHELAEANWFRRADIPPSESTMSLTSTMMETFRRGEFKNND